MRAPPLLSGNKSFIKEGSHSVELVCSSALLLDEDTVFLPCGGCSNMVPSWKHRAALTRHQTCWCLDLALSASRTERNKFLFFISDPVLRILL